MLVALKALQHIFVLARNPANAQSRQAVSFRHDIERQAFFITIGHLIDALARVEFQQPINFVAEQIQIMVSAQRNKSLVIFPRQDRPGRIVGAIPPYEFVGRDISRLYIKRPMLEGFAFLSRGRPIEEGSHGIGAATA